MGVKIAPFRVVGAYSVLRSIIIQPYPFLSPLFAPFLGLEFSKLPTFRQIDILDAHPPCNRAKKMATLREKTVESGQILSPLGFYYYGKLSMKKQSF